jgi:hypothetical protein
MFHNSLYERPFWLNYSLEIGTQLPAFVILTPIQYILKQSWQNVTNIRVINCLPVWYHMMFNNKQNTYYIKRVQGIGWMNIVTLSFGMRILTALSGWKI